MGIQKLLGLGRFADGAVPEHQLTAVVNVGDDAWMFGVRICPDLDTCMYTLGGGIDDERGWGRRNETWYAKAELAAYGVQPDWFGLGDRDLATHLVRSQMLRAGVPLSGVIDRLCERWNPGARLLPVSDDRVETHVVIRHPDDGSDHQSRPIHFQEWWVRYRAELPTDGFRFVGADQAVPGPGVKDAITQADVVFLAPSNPVVSIGPIVALPEVRDALRSTPAPVVGYSPIIGGRPLRGMADKCLSIVGVESTSEGVARYHGARSEDGLLDYWLVHEGDDARVDGVEVRAVPLLMKDPAATAEMVTAGFEMAGVRLIA
ncbi:2-phospho-L-lactate transferase [Mycolicibacterium litorale]|uniref:2-phospho-L-lactate transferase n=1 Tax=Mycolicibacterium litorale TaxID=758802 RepID=A0A6S6P554_9MYCO|nr:2-phospho-L-lactate transferase [Mycolicibacterium litorale]